MYVGITMCLMQLAKFYLRDICFKKCFIKILNSTAKSIACVVIYISSTWPGLVWSECSILQFTRLKTLFSEKSTHLHFWCLLTNKKKQKIQNFQATLLLWSNRSKALAKTGNLVKLPPCSIQSSSSLARESKARLFGLFLFWPQGRLFFYLYQFLVHNLLSFDCSMF